MLQKLTLALFLCSQIMYAQLGLTVQKSDIFQDEKKRSDLIFAEEDGQGGLVTVRAFYSGLNNKISGYYLEHHDKQLKVLNKTELASENYQLKGLKVADGIIYLISVYSDKSAKTWNVNLHTSPLEKLNFTQTVLISRDDIEKGHSTIFSFNQKDADAYDEVKFSKNKNFMCVSLDVKNKEEETHLIYVFDKNFKKTGDYVFSKDIKDKLFELDNIDVDDFNGGVYLQAKVFENDSRMTKKENKSNYHYEIYYLLGEEKKTLSFKEDDKFIGSLMAINDGGQLSYIGFYSELNDWRYKGVCRFEIDPGTFEIKHGSFAPFTEQFMIDKYGEKKEKELRNLVYKGAFKLNNGDIILNAEEFFITQVYVSYGMGGALSTIYNYNDIVALRIKEDGTLVWARNINKAQTLDGGRESFSSFAFNDKNYILVNCSDKIKQLSNNRIQFKQKRSKKTNLYAIALDADGNFTHQEIVDGDIEQMPYAVAKGVLTKNGNELILIGRNNKDKQFIKIFASE
ncbi:MAG: hypothetical protein KKC03_08180 [Bacteroidetes bacterium]|nr:hypothetical protein [Bacteroidota bacterium]